LIRGKSLIRLPRGAQSWLETSAHDLLNPPDGPRFDFSRPWGEHALIPPDSLSWRIFKNPVSLLIGGVAAVILELAEPAVRAGVWDHSCFRSHPMRRLQRTGLAAMVTVYGARSIAEPMIARVARLHSKIEGTTPGGLRYAASDVRLLSWVQATATFGFGEAYSRYVDPLTREELSTLCRESLPASTLYGALEVPTSSDGIQELFDATSACMEPSPVIFEFLHIMRTMRGFPSPLAWMQKALVRAAVDLIPQGIRERLGLTERFGLRTAERWLVLGVAAAADRLCLSKCPPAQACLRLGMPASKLYG
jgi:uncharacterized protein (DUF2236 family)